MQIIIDSSDEKVIQLILEMIRPLNVNYQEVRTSTTKPLSSKQPAKAKQPKNSMRKLGIMPGLVVQMSPDFNAPIEDFAGYM